MTFSKNLLVPDNLYTARRIKHIDVVTKLYFEEQFNLTEIYKHTGIAPQTAKKMIKEVGLPLRSRSEAVKLGKLKKKDR